MTNETTKYAYSDNAENWHGSYDSEAEAIMAAFEDNADKKTYVGKCEPPVNPEDYIDADLILNHITCQDEYCGEWAEDFPGATTEQEEDLTAMLQKTVAEWLDKHGLRPTFYMVHNEREVERPADMPIDPDLLDED